MSWTVRELMQATAAHLTGKQVTIRNDFDGYPIVGEAKSHVVAATHAGTDGTPVITIYHCGISQNGHEKARHFLHECAHVLMHASKMAATESVSRADLDAYVTDPAIKNVTQNWEDQADCLADQWMKYAVAHVRPFERENLISLLKALLNAPLDTGEI